MVVSLAQYIEREVEVKLPLEIAGYASPEVRYYKVRVVAEKTTAIEGVHYNALEEQYAFRAGECFDSLAVTFRTHDPDLLENPRRLYLELVPTDDLVAGIAHMQHADVRIGTGLTKPRDWFFDIYYPYPTYYQYYLGDYSRVKHAMILEMFDLDEIPSRWDGNVAQWDYVGMKLNQYFTENAVLDETGAQIQPWR
jgi:hypothetical protein